MDKIITIKPLELDEVNISTASPITSRRTKITKEVAQKFIDFTETRKAAIDEEDLKAIKPELDVSTLKSYEEILTPERLKHKIEKINKLLVKYGYSSLCLSYDNIVELLNGKTENTIAEEQPKEIVENPFETINNFSLNDDDIIIEDELENLEDGRKLVA